MKEPALGEISLPSLARKAGALRLVFPPQAELEDYAHHHQPEAKLAKFPGHGGFPMASTKHDSVFRCLDDGFHTVVLFLPSGSKYLESYIFFTTIVELWDFIILWFKNPSY